MSSHKTFHIEVRCMNVDSDEKLEQMKIAVARAARSLHGKAMLVLGSQTPPQVLIYGEDFLHGQQEILVMAPAEEDDA